MSVTDSRTPPLDHEEAARARREQVLRIAKWTLPSLVMVLTLLGWHLYVTLWEVPHYILPGPLLVLDKLIEDWDLLWAATLTTGRLTLLALVFAILGGALLAVAFTQSKWIEMSFFPYAVILQVTPVVAIAPLLQIYLDSPFVAALLCAWIVAFFPILSNTTVGLKSTDRNLEDLYTIYGASRWQRLRYLAAPSALPYFLSGLKIAGGLALIGAVVAEFVIGRAGTGLGLASTLLEASYRFNFGRLYAALILISLMGVTIFAVMSLISHLALFRWHESALKKDG
ncbi:NitT/TauT family transport system permease protein [Mameliella alba]|uniref:ABC transporter permease n=1 Tax=Mameliella alba TaxID=561184 RepID=UPI00088C27E1|nr:ABC transporter permease [Mameliella alba]OWV50022.1 ABC transporter permease [Mameliella alba]PTR42601.1 NitT/TauT family transport system permease protein [Mameliella alba]GGF72195.1 ABC transporter ATP-binding protein [Mameliella alba]SDC17227.1 NitT/TauT family transport system permease protein [Mameliella alba]